MNNKLKIASLTLLALAGFSASADQGRIYGTVYAVDDVSITGAIRWNDEEVFWTDHFNGRKAKATDLSGLDDDDQETILDRQPGPQLEIDGNVIELIKIFGNSDLEPQDFYLEFGSISVIEPLGGDNARITLRDGSQIEADGGSNDLGTDIMIRGDDGTDHELDWDDVERVVFANTAEGGPTFGDHLYGEIKTEVGDFRGIVQWDHDERVGSQKLDGDVDGNDVSVEFGNIVSITKEKNGSRVITRDDANLFLIGSNDVNDENRGIYVDDPRFGRVDISWEQFISVTFLQDQNRPTTGYGDFSKVGRLQGTVVDDDGKRYTGSLTYDIDESTSAEMISGRTTDGLRYMIPLRLISSITRGDDKSALIKLTGGDQISLQGDRDVNHKNNGIIIEVEGQKPQYVDWKKVSVVTFSGE